ncbi:hypothetical protein ADK54_17280 [Streptomyces sp. WM6378]|nr:hypothetical protein ADK54_17280 [Streptomyces sp. WM6378]
MRVARLRRTSLLPLSRARLLLSFQRLGLGGRIVLCVCVVGGWLRGILTARHVWRCDFDDLRRCRRRVAHLFRRDGLSR